MLSPLRFLNTFDSKTIIDKSKAGRKLKKIWNLVAKDLWIVLLDIIAVNAAYYLALLIRFFDNVEFRPAEGRFVAIDG